MLIKVNLAALAALAAAEKHGFTVESRTSNQGTICLCRQCDKGHSGYSYCHEDPHFAKRFINNACNRVNYQACMENKGFCVVDHVAVADQMESQGQAFDAATGNFLQKEAKTHKSKGKRRAKVAKRATSASQSASATESPEWWQNLDLDSADYGLGKIDLHSEGDDPYESRDYNLNLEEYPDHGHVDHESIIWGDEPDLDHGHAHLTPTTASDCAAHTTPGQCEHGSDLCKWRDTCTPTDFMSAEDLDCYYTCKDNSLLIETCERACNKLGGLGGGEGADIPEGALDYVPDDWDHVHTDENDHVGPSGHDHDDDDLDDDGEHAEDAFDSHSHDDEDYEEVEYVCDHEDPEAAECDFESDDCEDAWPAVQNGELNPQPVGGCVWKVDDGTDQDSEEDAEADASADTAEADADDVQEAAAADSVIPSPDLSADEDRAEVQFDDLTDTKKIDDILWADSIGGIGTGVEDFSDLDAYSSSDSFDDKWNSDSNKMDSPTTSWDPSSYKFDDSDNELWFRDDDHGDHLSYDDLWFLQLKSQKKVISAAMAERKKARKTTRKTKKASRSKKAKAVLPKPPLPVSKHSPRAVNFYQMEDEHASCPMTLVMREKKAHEVALAKEKSTKVEEK